MATKKTKMIAVENVKGEITMAKNNLNRHPTLANGKVCYIEIPSIDINRSAWAHQR